MEAAPTSHFLLDTARALLQSMRRTYTSGSCYYDRSLLEEDVKEIPLRSEASKENSQVDPQSMLPSAGGLTMTLGDFLGEDPGAYERALSNNRQSASVGYNPNTPGVYRTWDGGRDFSLDDSNIDDNQPDSLQQPSSNTYIGRESQPFPQLSLPMDNPFIHNRTKMGRDLRQPWNRTRYNFRDSQSYNSKFPSNCRAILLCSTIFHHPMPQKGFLKIRALQFGQRLFQDSFYPICAIEKYGKINGYGVTSIKRS